MQPLLQDPTEELLLLHVHAHQRVEEELRAGDVHHWTDGRRRRRQTPSNSKRPVSAGGPLCVLGRCAETVSSWSGGALSGALWELRLTFSGSGIDQVLGPLGLLQSLVKSLLRVKLRLLQGDSHHGNQLSHDGVTA